MVIIRAAFFGMVISMQCYLCTVIIRVLLFGTVIALWCYSVELLFVCSILQNGDITVVVIQCGYYSVQLIFVRHPLLL